MKNFLINLAILIALAAGVVRTVAVLTANSAQ